MARTALVSLRLEPETKEALDRAAKDEDRKTADLVAAVVKLWLRQHGYLNGKKAKR